MAVDEPGGTAALADAVALLIRQVRVRDRDAVITFELHMDDPHLQPVLADVAITATDPVDLVEVC